MSLRVPIRAPALRLIKQTSLSEEKVTKRGKTSSVYVVVKNSPFQLSIGLDGSLTNLNHLSFDMSLIYDMPGEDKEVSYVSTKPIDYKTILNDMGDQICFDVKIKVLSSHHEDNFFRLKVLVWDPTAEEFPMLEVLSYPIKVISKPMNQRKTPKKRAAPTRRNTASKQAQVPVSPPSENTSEELRSCSASIQTSLGKIDYQQQETLRLLHEMMSRNIQSHNYESDERPAKRPRIEAPIAQLVPVTPAPDFESSFSTMLQCYSVMSAEEKAERLRKLLRTMPSRDKEQLEELCDVMAAAGLKTEAPIQQFTGISTSGYNPLTLSGLVHSDPCNDSCPHHNQLVKIDQFYNDVFF